MNNLVGGNDRLSVTRGQTGVRAPMDLLNWDPFRNFFSNVPAASGIEINKTDSGYFVEVPVPGYKPDEIDITVENGVLSVAGKTEKRSFARSFLIPDDVDADNITATVEHGMLGLTLHLLPKAQPKKITIKTS